MPEESDIVKKYLDKDTLECLKENGIDDLFPVQCHIYKELLGNANNLSYSDAFPKFNSRPRDICCSAPTGSGKTLAFVIPLLQILKYRTFVSIRGLVVLPGSDLALQVYNVFKKFSKDTDIKIGLANGLKNFQNEQLTLVKEGPLGMESKVDILVCTPGRLVDHINQTRGFNLANLRFLVIDEVDRMIEQVKQDWLNQVDSAVRRDIKNEDMRGLVGLAEQFNLNPDNGDDDDGGVDGNEGNGDDKVEGNDDDKVEGNDDDKVKGNDDKVVGNDDDKFKGNKGNDDKVKVNDDKVNENKGNDDKVKGNKGKNDKINENKGNGDDKVIGNKGNDDKVKGYNDKVKGNDKVDENKGNDDKVIVNKANDKVIVNKANDDKVNRNKGKDDKINTNKGIDDKVKGNKVNDKEGDFLNKDNSDSIDKVLHSFRSLNMGSSAWKRRLYKGFKFNQYLPCQKLLFSATLTSNPEQLHQLDLYHPKFFTCASNRLLPKNNIQLKNKSIAIGGVVTGEGDDNKNKNNNNNNNNKSTVTVVTGDDYNKNRNNNNNNNNDEFFFAASDTASCCVVEEGVSGKVDGGVSGKKKKSTTGTDACADGKKTIEIQKREKKLLSLALNSSEIGVKKKKTINDNEKDGEDYNNNNNNNNEEKEELLLGATAKKRSRMTSVEEGTTSSSLPMKKLSSSSVNNSKTAGSTIPSANIPVATIPGATMTGATTDNDNEERNILSSRNNSKTIGTTIPVSAKAAAIMAVATIPGSTMVGATMAGATTTDDDNEERNNAPENILRMYVTPSGLKEFFVECNESSKPLVLMHLINNLKMKGVLCFVNSVESSRRLSRLLKLAGIRAAEISSNLQILRRIRIFKQFNAGKLDIVVATDSVARGIDLENINCVISYDIAPLKTYVHRTGRTARAGKSGTAITFLDRKQILFFKSLLRGIGKTDVKEMKVKNFQLKEFVETYQKALKLLPSFLKGS